MLDQIGPLKKKSLRWVKELASLWKDENKETHSGFAVIFQLIDREKKKKKPRKSS